MKTIVLSIAAVLSMGYLSAQEENKKENRIETIKIINGDTVLHDVRIEESTGLSEERMRRVHRFKEADVDELSNEVEEMLKEMDVYVSLDDGKKKMIVKRMEMNGEDMEEFMKEWKDGDDMIIDMDGSRKMIKIISIDIDEEKGQEVKEIEMKKGPGKKGSHPDPSVRGQKPLMKDGLHVFPNPSNGEINLNFEVIDGPTEVRVMDGSGKEIFSKTYEKEGSVQEKIELKKNDKGMHIISLKDKSRSITKKIIIE